MAELPRVIPLFPLPNLVLFPGVAVPLHIFEPRYREMIADVSASHGIIGMMLLKGDWEREYYANPDTFAIGCAGKISQLVKLADGRYNLMLEGMSEFRILREDRELSYRRAEIEWCPIDPPLDLDAEAMEGLRQLLFEYLGDNAGAAWKSLVERGLRGSDLVNFLCFHLDIPAIEKQTLLEARGARLDCLFDVLTFKLEERKLGGPGPHSGSGSVQ
ncbi:MAG TPA: LON peptidase substrate-binding domain-containing protein [Candidatus Binataceae bacterium]|nr:LON peptidase substrate-binding domain-containing protein [Candidatus Binataceae bacterium]